MNKDCIWEFAIKIPKKNRWSVIQTLKSKIIPTIDLLVEEIGCKWFCFLVHGNRNGVPIPDYDGWHYHVRFEVKKYITHYSKKTIEDYLHKLLPDYCLELRKAELVTQINGVDNKLFKFANNDYEVAWLLLYWQCHWVYTFVRAHKRLTLRQVYQYLHYFDNIFGRECKVKPKKAKKGVIKSLCPKRIWVQTPGRDSGKNHRCTKDNGHKGRHLCHCGYEW